MSKEGKGWRNRALTLEFGALLVIVVVNFVFGLWHFVRSLFGLA